ncbi:FGGY-family carbohydrate kinase [Yeguia hominis]|uniref:FGGY-family carbohydrate kinase n=1 Tax=Yeguia hominis TaxID=2763662 RepID=A0A926D914_9FIRM|nr:FGGY-family carbohydrate kinase [Yeguia hominis]MBC8533559.1 FGGY-family carbohydrate kinase [Yeguia hominis]
MNYLIGTDIGTSGTKSILMDTEGNLIAQDLQEYDVLTPKPLWAEQWPDVWVEATKTSIRNAREKAGVSPEDIKGIAISGLYGGSGIPVDEHMKPVRPCLIWMDRRATEQEKWVKETIGEEKMRAITHNGIDPYYGYLKILWVKDNEPENWAKTKLFLPPNAYTIYELTGAVTIDYSSAGNIGGIFDMNTKTWSYELMDEMGIPRSMMPERLVECTEVVGTLTAQAAAEMGLKEGTPVISGGVDCGAASLGLGVFEPGVYAAAIGTSMCAALVHADTIKGKNLTEWPYVIEPKRLSYLFGGSATAGALIKWFRDNFAELEKEAELAGGENAYAVLDRKAAQIAPGSEGLIVLPYFMGERGPVWDTDAKGTIFGLSLTHTKAHVYRAFLETVAYSLRHTMECTSDDLGEYILIAGGVAKSKVWRQIFADVTGYPVVCPIHDVEANLGDVMLAGIATGLLTFDDVKKWQVLGDRIQPNPEAHEKYNRYYALYRKLYQDLKEDMRTLSEIR